ncbi:MAG: hypothetical protein LBB88_02115 [Planctomycetaceae bacterium]|jgi:hypothetical protein|nr:hypothetical protein [Planctomycetaceae bacterium]
MLKKFSNLQISFLALAGLILFSSCSNGYVQFGGKVTDSNGQPYTKGYVVFSNGKVSARGKLQSDGTYKLGSLKDSDGLVLGAYQVSISGHHEYIETPNGLIPVSDIDAKYESGSTSGLSCEVTKGGHFDFNVELKKK